METSVKQACFLGLKPPVPTMRTPRVARAIAQRIVKTVNDDDFYWEPEEVPERIADVTEEIVRCGRPATVFSRLDKRDTDANHYGWEDIDEHCRAIADEIAEGLADVDRGDDGLVGPDRVLLGRRRLPQAYPFGDVVLHDDLVDRTAGADRRAVGNRRTNDRVEVAVHAAAGHA